VKKILVYADWLDQPQAVLMGLLYTQVSKGEEIFSFEYSTDWLESEYSQVIDPDLKLYSGPQYLNDEKQNFGIFLDSSPDRWGRMLIKQRAGIKQRVSGEQSRHLYESDYLLGLNDETRMGGIRFKLQQDGNYLDHDDSLRTPPITSIRELEQVSQKIEEDDFSSDSLSIEWLNIMMAPGSSLGGARPKASVVDTDGSLWIAKFPSKNDEKDSGIWEFLVNKMASNLNINTAEAKASIFSQKQHTYLTKRFDRAGQDKRIHFASAMTLLGYKDGYNQKEGGSYLEMVELIERYGASPDQDIKELWRRIVFSVAVSNTDDHLGNHGFLLTQTGWALSPAYDINPNENGRGLSLNISEDDNSLDFDLCLSVADYFRYDHSEAKAYIQIVKKEVANWSDNATALNISRKEQMQMEVAFNY